MHDGQIADTLLDHLGPRTIVLADKAYDADRIRELIQEQGATPNIPPKSNRRWKPCFSKRLYRERNLIERFSSKLKHVRRVTTSYDKLAAKCLAMSSSPRCGCGCALKSLRPRSPLGTQSLRALMDPTVGAVRYLSAWGAYLFGC